MKRQLLLGKEGESKLLGWNAKRKRFSLVEPPGLFFHCEKSTNLLSYNKKCGTFE